MIRAGAVDQASMACAIAAGLAYWILASAGLRLWQVDPIWQSVWLPNAGVVAFLLLVRLRNEIPLLAAITGASMIALYMAGHSAFDAAILSAAQLIDVLLVTGLVRKSTADRSAATQDSDDHDGLDRLGPVLQYGGVAGPMALCAVAALALGPDWSALAAWMLADSMGMILIVPAALVIAQYLRAKPGPVQSSLAERILLITGGLAAVYFVFQQSLYPLMFLVPPVTLLIAFRIGALGTALYVPALALVGAVMTYRGIGPIVNAVPGAAVQTHLLQAFIAANFLTGLPIAAILAGRTRMTEALARSRSELSLLTENITDAVLWIGRDGACRYASPSVEDVLGIAPQDVIRPDPSKDDPATRAFAAAIDAPTQAEFAALLARLFDGSCNTGRLTFRRCRDDGAGAAVYVEADCAIALSPDGARNTVVISARNVTQRIELEQQLTRARRTAEQAAHAKSEFLANMSHEIRTPMNGVLGFAELMLQGDLDANTRAHADMIAQSGRSMMRLLNDILDLSKIEAREIVIEHEPVDVIATIKECAALHQAAAQDKGLSLSAPGYADVDPARIWVMSDGMRLRQILLNLVGNAVKFTETGAVQIALEYGESEISIAVTDSGIGIAPDRLEGIFAPFTQAESSTARRFGGTGLGLSISRQLAHLLGGSIHAQSAPDRGSVFRLSLPATFVEAPDADQQMDQQIESHTSAPRDRQDPPSDADHAPKMGPDMPHGRDERNKLAGAMAIMPPAARILLVEDHDVNRMLGAEMLERCGQSVEIAYDGNEAIAMVIDAIMRDRPFDLVLMDIQMPGCDGYAACRAIREDGIGPDQLPIIALTANAFPEDIAAARTAGMQAHLAKPIVFADLARALQRWLPTRIVAQDDDRMEPGQSEQNLNGSPPITAPGDSASRPRRVEGTVEGTVEDTIEATMEGAPALIETKIIDTSRPAPSWTRNAKGMSAARGANVSPYTAPQSPQTHSPQTGPNAAPAAAAFRRPPTPPMAPRRHSPAVLKRWQERRHEAVEAVRRALETGALEPSALETGGDTQNGETGKGNEGKGNESAQQAHEDLTRLVHKLAGTAAIFDEPELGDQAAALEHALRMPLAGEVRAALALELLSVAEAHETQERSAPD
ncbi:MAG: response regulator [Erythrobacter sp.]|nr:response regulator [Erythrobacter sp.]